MQLVIAQQCVQESSPPGNILASLECTVLIEGRHFIIFKDESGSYVIQSP